MGGFAWKRGGAETARSAVEKRIGRGGFLLAAGEAKRLMEGFVPMDTGELVRSAVVSSESGRGIVTYTAPHAAFCYYGSALSFNREHNPQAAAFWDREMMRFHGRALADFMERVL